MQRFYAIYDKISERLVTTYASQTCPALYPTYGMANGVLKKRRKGADRHLWSHHEVCEVELHIR